MNGTIYQGMDAITYDRAQVEKYSGKWTNELIYNICEDYPSLIIGQDEIIIDNDLLGGESIIENSLYQIIKYNYINSNGTIKKVDEVIPGNINNLSYSYSKGWEKILYGIWNYGIFFSILAIIVISPIFSREHDQGTADLIFTTKYGRNKSTYAKTISCLIASTAIWFVMLIPIFVFCLLVYGTSGINTSIQLLDYGLMFGSYPNEMTLGSLVLISILLTWMALSVTAFLCSLISTLTRSSFKAIIIATVIFFVPKFSMGIHGLDRVFQLFPVRYLLTHEIISAQPYQLFGIRFSAVLMVVIVSCIIFVVSWVGNYKITSKIR